MTSINSAQAREAVYQRFAAQWVVSGAERTPFTLENEQFDGDDPPTWARCTMRSLGGGGATIGPETKRKYERLIAVFVDIFTPVNDTGMVDPDGHGIAAMDIFEGRRFSGVMMNDAQLRELGDDGKHYHTQVEVLGFYEETK